MQTMYPAMINSPVTTLASGIDTTQTTIEVTDGTKLPVAPNLATLGGGENVETILYTGKAGNTLTGVTRGVQGTAKAWTTGTQIGRFFTAYDHDALKANIEEIATLYAKKQQEQWIPITLLNGWVNNSSDHEPATYFKDNFGIVRLRGFIKSGVTTGLTPMFVLPAGYRPSKNCMGVTVSNNGVTDVIARINIRPDGTVEFLIGGNAWFNLSGISFRAEQ